MMKTLVFLELGFWVWDGEGSDEGYFLGGVKKRVKDCKRKTYIGFDFVKELQIRDLRGVLCK